VFDGLPNGPKYLLAFDLQGTEDLHGHRSRPRATQSLNQAGLRGRLPKLLEGFVSDARLPGRVPEALGSMGKLGGVHDDLLVHPHAADDQGCE
jgi:hypothetical protein